MNQDNLIKQITENVIAVLAEQNGSTSTPAKTCNTNKMTAANYPLGEKSVDKIFTPTGKKLNDLKLEQVVSGEVDGNDLRISKETLEYQAQVAESVNRHALARNLRRAAEMIAIPDERTLEIYNALRPYRSTKQELLNIADELKNKYNAIITSDFVKEAADVYEQRGRLKAD